MSEPRDIAAQVIANRTVTDARHAGGFSIWGLALRFRGHFKWEQD